MVSFITIFQGSALLRFLRCAFKEVAFTWWKLDVNFILIFSRVTWTSLHLVRTSLKEATFQIEIAERLSSSPPHSFSSPILLIQAKGFWGFAEMGKCLNYQQLLEKKSISMLLTQTAFYACHKCMPWLTFLLWLILIHSGMKRIWFINSKAQNEIVTSEHCWQSSSHFLCVFPIIFPKKRNTTSHWMGGTASLNQESVSLACNQTLCGIAAENSPAFLRTNTVGAVRKSHSDGQGGLRTGAVRGDSLGWAVQGGDPGYPLSCRTVGRGCWAFVRETAERENAKPSGDAWHWGSWDPSCLSVKGISDPIIRVWGFFFPVMKQPAGTLNIVKTDSRVVRWMFFVSKESNCKYLFL